MAYKRPCYKGASYYRILSSAYEDTQPNYVILSLPELNRKSIMIVALSFESVGGTLKYCDYLNEGYWMVLSRGRCCLSLKLLSADTFLI